MNEVSKPVVSVLKGAPNGQAKEAEAKISPVSTAEVKTITFTSVGGRRWEIEFTGPVSRRDVNGLRVRMLVEWNRMKRKNRLKKLTIGRFEANRKAVLDGYRDKIVG